MYEHIQVSLLLGRRTKCNLYYCFYSFLQVIERGLLQIISRFDERERKHPQMGTIAFLIEVQNCGTAFQLRLNRHPPLLCSVKNLIDSAFFLPSGGCPRPAASMLNCCWIGDWDLLWGFCYRLGEVGRGDRGCSSCLIVGEVSQSTGFISFLLLLQIRVYFSVCIFIISSFKCFYPVLFIVIFMRRTP